MQPADANEELIEWLDDDGHIIDVVRRSRMRRENLLHRSVAIIVHSSDGRLLVHQRAATKDLRPNWWDIGAGGVVSAGEAIDDAARREVAEEVGIVGVPLEWIAVDRFDGVDSREVCNLFRVVHDGPYTFADGEVQRAELVTPAEFAELAAHVPFLESIAMILPYVAGFDVPPSVRDRSPRPDAADTLTGVHRVEFTVEPFIEGQPGPHVVAPIEALKAAGFDVEVGPFGSSCLIDPAASADAVAIIVREAFAQGATHVNVDVSDEAVR